MKKTRMLLLGVAAVLAVIACLVVSGTVSQFSRRVPVLVARTHLLAGAVVTDADVEVRQVHPANVPAGALTSPAQAVGQRVLAERLPGDILTASALGEAQVFPLAPDEVAVAVSVDRVTGLSGLLRPGDRVTVIGVVASANLPSSFGAAPALAVPGQEAPTQVEVSPLPYAHIYLRGLRVLFIHHEFVYAPPQPVSADASSGGLVPVSSSATRQADAGVVVLAVPVGPVPVSIYQQGMEQQIRFLSPAEVVALLNATARVHLALEPLERQDVESYGVRLSDLLPISSTTAITQPVMPLPTEAPPAPTETPAPEQQGGGGGQ
jgi:Flp pilus assembly protein CpaB